MWHLGTNICRRSHKRQLWCTGKSTLVCRVEYIICRSVWCMSKPNCEPKGLTHSLTFSCGCLAITTSLFFWRFSTLLIHRIDASLHGWVYICPCSACVTTSPSHSRAKPQFRNWGSEWWRTWSILGLVGRGGFVEEWETPGHSVCHSEESRDPGGWMENLGDWLTMGPCLGNSGWQCVCGLRYSDIWSLLEYYQSNCIRWPPFSTYRVVRVKLAGTIYLLLLLLYYLIYLIV